MSPNDASAPRLEGADTSLDANSDTQDMFEENAPQQERAHEETGIDAPIVMPNTPSAPVWSLAAQHAPEQPVVHVETKTEATSHSAGSSNGAKPIQEASAIEQTPAAVVQPEQAAAAVPEQPARKGWWQRPFKLRD